MTRQEAMEAARVFLNEQYPTAPPTIVLREEWAEEHAWAWRVVFDTQEYLDAGDIGQRPMSRALYVRKDTGEVDFVPSAMSTEVSKRYLETGIWPFSPRGATSNGQGAPDDRARAWLRELYGPVVELATPGPVAETAQAWWYAVRPLAQPGYPATAMLNASLVVPKDGSVPFHPGNADPWGDVTALAGDPRPRLRRDWEYRVNARGCVVTVDAAISGATATVLPWHPAHEAPGWWSRLVRRYFTGAEVAVCADWSQVVAAVDAGGTDTRGVVWVQRELGGVEATGHLLYAYNDGNRVVVLDGQTGGLARLDATGIRKLTLARFHRPRGETAATVPEWLLPAPDLAAAVRKAQAWLGETYCGQVALVAPEASDDHGRGWLFACNTHALLAGGDWREGMLDAALVVPKDDSAPFGLPNTDPWRWYGHWLAGGVPGTGGMPLPPAPGPAAWYAPTMAQLGTVQQTVEVPDWPSALAVIAGSPQGARMLAWVRRRDRRGRESVGRLVTAANTARGLILLDPSREGPAELDTEGVISIRLMRYR